MLPLQALTQMNTPNLCFQLNQTSCSAFRCRARFANCHMRAITNGISATKNFANIIPRRKETSLRAKPKCIDNRIWGAKKIFASTRTVPLGNGVDSSQPLRVCSLRLIRCFRNSCNMDNCQELCMAFG